MKPFKLFQVSITVGYDTAILIEIDPPATSICHHIHEDAEWHVNGVRTTREDAILQIMCCDDPIEVQLFECEHLEGTIAKACYRCVELQIPRDDIM